MPNGIISDGNWKPNLGGSLPQNKGKHWFLDLERRSKFSSKGQKLFNLKLVDFGFTIYIKNVSIFNFLAQDTSIVGKSEFLCH